MAKCGQVCRFWAAKCRESLFRSVALRSRQDVLDFCNFKRDPACTFFSQIIRLTVPILDISDKPWVHNITQVWNDPTASSLSLSIEGPIPRRWKTLRSMHQAVPQSLPPRFSSNITHLKLTNIRFRSFQDLAHLANELPHLQELNGSKLTWDSFPAMLPRQRENKSSNGMRTWMLDGCEAPFATAALYLFMSIYRGASYLSLIDVPIVNALADALETETKAFGGTAHPCSLEGTPPAFRLTVIAIEPEVRDAANTRLPINWSSFDIAANNFRFLRMVILGFAERERALRFADNVVDSSMPLLAARGALRYAVLPKNVWSWQQMSRDSDVVRDSGMRNLVEAYT
ncbi:hypothetical protein EIP86_001622 [Pleurotus ostreatoroseus]|nr:hypothetical protein EIP86_001622 [Pleurotus ostreatoroseus]